MCVGFQRSQLCMRKIILEISKLASFLLYILLKCSSDVLVSQSKEVDRNVTCICLALSLYVRIYVNKYSTHNIFYLYHDLCHVNS